MLRTSLLSALTLSVSLSAEPVWGQETKEPELLPPPRPAVVAPPQLSGTAPVFRIYLQPLPHMPFPPGYIPPQPPRPQTREQWRSYGIDFDQQIVRRVILTPSGGYYYATGQPYPWLTTRTTNYMYKIQRSPY